MPISLKPDLTFSQPKKVHKVMWNSIPLRVFCAKVNKTAAAFLHKISEFQETFKLLHPTAHIYVSSKFLFLIDMSRSGEGNRL